MGLDSDVDAVRRIDGDLKQIRFDWQAFVKDRLPTGFTYKFVSHEDEDAVTFRMAIETEEGAVDWIKSLKGSEWRVRKVFPSAHSYIYKTERRCQHKVYHKKRKNASVKCYKSKDTGCPSRLSLTVKNKSMSYSKDSLLPKWPTVVVFHYTHNHSTDSAEAKRCLDVTDATRTKLLSLYANGYTTRAALEELVLDIEEACTDGRTFSEACCNRSVLPDYKYAGRLYKQNHGRTPKKAESARVPSAEEIVEAFQRHLPSNEDLKYQAVLQGEAAILAIITPSMRRAHSLVSAGKCVLLDSTHVSNRTSHFLYMLVTDTQGAGPVPLGFFLTTDNSVESIVTGLQSLMHIADSDSFGGRGVDGPDAFIVTELGTQLQAVHRAFPLSKTVVLGDSLLKHCYQWLHSADCTVAVDERPQCFSFIEQLVTSGTEEQLLQRYTEKEAPFVCAGSQNMGYLSFIEQLWSQRDLWASCYKTEVLTDCELESYNQTMLPVLKEVLAFRTRSYSLLQVAIFLSTRFEAHWRRILVDLSHNRPPIDLWTNHLAYKQHQQSFIHISKQPHPEFKVQMKGEEFMVNTMLDKCSCNSRTKYAMCIHQVAVLQHRYQATQKLCGTRVLKPDLRKILYNIAVGCEVIREEVIGGESVQVFNEQRHVLAVNTDTEYLQEFDRWVQETREQLAKNPEQFRKPVLQFTKKWSQLGAAEQARWLCYSPRPSTRVKRVVNPSHPVECENSRPPTQAMEIEATSHDNPTDMEHVQLLIV